MRLEVFKETPARLPIRRLKRLFDMVIRSEGRPGWRGSVNLVICTDARLRSLNRRFRAHDRATDVLSFNIDRPDQPGAVFGEIYIAAPSVRRQARAHGRGVFGEYLLLVCHGLLHLTGYDHDTRSKERVMFSRQAHYLERLAGGR